MKSTQLHVIALIFEQRSVTSSDPATGLTLATESVVNVIDLLRNRGSTEALLSSLLDHRDICLKRQQGLFNCHRRYREEIPLVFVFRAVVGWSHVGRIASNCPASVMPHGASDI